MRMLSPASLHPAPGLRSSLLYLGKRVEALPWAVFAAFTPTSLNLGREVLSEM